MPQVASTSTCLQVLHHDAFQRPPQTTPRELGPWFGRAASVLAPHVTAAIAPVPANSHVQRSGPPPEWFVRQPAQDAVARRALAAAAPAPLVRFGDTACEDRTVWIKPLAGDFEPELVQSTEGSQVSAGQTRTRTSVIHVRRCFSTPQLAGSAADAVQLGHVFIGEGEPGTGDVLAQMRRR